jgi:hypothetical protein
MCIALSHECIPGEVFVVDVTMVPFLGQYISPTFLLQNLRFSDMKFEVLMVVKISMLVFWVVLPCWPCTYCPFWKNTLPPSSGLKMEAVTFLQNVGIYIQEHSQC